MENGRDNVLPGTANELARALGVSLDGVNAAFGYPRAEIFAQAHGSRGQAASGQQATAMPPRADMQSAAMVVCLAVTPALAQMR
jgi:hypothetical protein